MVQGSNPGGGKFFCACPDQPWGLPNLLDTGFVPEVKWLGHGIDHLHLSNTEVRESIELYLFSHS
jgi:hypothetical protein